MGSRLPAVLGLALLAACAGGADEFDRPYVSERLKERTGHGLGEGALPPGVSLEDGVTEEEAVAIALWRNADFAEALAELGFRRADLVQAGMLPNPVLSLLFPLGPKQLEFTAKLPLEALWLRPSRMAIAEADAERAAALLVQGGLDLVRDVRRAFAERVLAARRVELSREIASAREQLDEIAQARLRAGDAGELEASAARADHFRARAQVAQDLLADDLARDRLRALLGFARDTAPLEFKAGGMRELGGRREARFKEALAARPDVRAAEYAIEAAGERAGLARWEFLAISGILDANNKGTKGFEAGPGVELPVPLFNQGQASRTRAEAEVERAARHYLAVRDRVALEVRAAEALHARAIEVRHERTGALDLADAALAATVRAEQAGETSMKSVGEARIRAAEARLQEAEAGADLRRGRAELERAVGRRLE